MKVIKRDGRAVEYDREKIQTAIEKANQEVNLQNRVSKEEIKEITTYIEDLNKKRILVEDIQDIIEEKLMEFKKYELAKKYIVYRYTRALVRKQNTTDETILGIIRNSSEDFDRKNNMTASEQRNYIAGEVSRDLTKRLLLPEKIAKAEEEHILRSHNKDFFVHPMINSSIINISDMLDNGTVINGSSIESPKSFLVACIVATQIIGVIASNQCGEQIIDMIHFGKYVRRSYYKYKEQIEKEYKEKLNPEFIENLAREKVKIELKDGIQMIQYQINTLESIIGRKPKVALILHIEEDEYVKENAMIIEAILRQRYEGIKDENQNNISPDFPRLIYILNKLNFAEDRILEENNLKNKDINDCDKKENYLDRIQLKDGEYSYLTNLAIKCTNKRKSPQYISVTEIKEKEICQCGKESFLSIVKNADGSITFEPIFNQGIVSINLPQIAKLSEGDEAKFWCLLDERLDLCFEALMCKHYSLVGAQASVSPLHWKYGALARLKDGEKIDKYLYGEYSTLALGYERISKTAPSIKDKILQKNKVEKGKETQMESQLENVNSNLEIKVTEYLNKTIEKWKKETNIEFVLCEIT